MAKSRRSGGYFGNTAGESEGSGTSGAIDTEMTVSENSSIPTRKSINLNSSCRDAFGVSAQVVPLSRMSPFERKGLARRLRSELEQIRQLQRRIELQRTSGVTLSASSDILSCSNGNKGRRVENSRKKSMSSSVPGGISKPVGKSQKAHGWNRGSTGKFETASLPSSANALLMKECDSVLKRLMKHQHAWVFNTPVDVVKLNLPDYFTIIKHPMDLGTVKSKIAAGAYKEPSEFADDVRLTFSNAMTYNPPGNDVHIMADTLNKYFEMRWKAIEKKLPRSDDLPLPTKPDTCEEVKTSKPMPPSKKRKISTLPPEPDVMPPARQVMSDQEKQNLGQQLESLMAEIPAHIIDFLKEHSSNGRDCGEDEIEIDIDDLSDDTLFTLRRLLDEFLQEKQKSKAKVEACEIEVLNDSGPSNSSLQPFKGNAADEEVDIVGFEPPVSSYPHVEVEKDLTCRMNKSLSPGSSSDSDSSSSSDGESDDIKASPINGAKVPENMGSQAQLDEKTRASDTPNRNQSVSGLDQLEDNSQHKPISFDSDCHQEGDSGPAERQVSPDKLYRAAVLKKRFLDTILKAQEKTLMQGEKGDPEKLRQEREKLEMEQRREKARLQAEVKAAEDARKQAEAEAAAEARRKRELEREVARKALQQMERTVEINENSRFLKDLEMLRAESAEQLPSPVDETSPDHSQDGLGSFKFGSSNPLEQLGLYMKADDEEDEGEPPCIQNPQNDVEEEEGEPPCIPNPQNDVQEEEGELPCIQNPQNDAEEEEEGEPPFIQNPQNDVEEEEGELPCIQNPQNDVEEEEGEPTYIQNPQNDVEEEEGELPSIQNPQNDVEEEEGEPTYIQNPQNDIKEEEGEPPCIQNPQNDVEEEEGELHCIQNPQNGVEEEEGEPPFIQNPQNDVEEEEGEPTYIQNPQNDIEEEEGEQPCIQNPQNVVEEEEGEQPCIQNAQNGVEEEEGEQPCIQNPQNVVEEEEREQPCIQNHQNGVEEEEGEPPFIQIPQNDVEEEEGEPTYIQNPQNDVEEEGEPTYIQSPQNDIEGEEGEPPFIQNPQNDVEEEEGEPTYIQNPQNDVEEEEGEPTYIKNPQNDIEEEEGEPPCIQNPQNDVEAEEGEQPCIQNPQNDVEEEEGGLPCIQNPQDDVEDEEGEQPGIQNPQNEVEEEEGEPPFIQNPQNDVEKEGEPTYIQNPQNDIEEEEGEPPCIQNPQNDIEEEEGEPPCIQNPKNDVEEEEGIQDPKNDVEEEEGIQNPQNDVEKEEID